MPIPPAVMAAMHAIGDMSLRNMEAHYPMLVKRLQKFNKAETLALVGGLLTIPQFHANTCRLEALAHLVAAHCAGSESPDAALMQDWINKVLSPGPAGMSEDPIEDVFISNVLCWWGNIRLFEGVWEANDFGLQESLQALRVFPNLPPIARAIRALLLLSEETAKRSHTPRYIMGEGKPRAALRFSTASLREWAERVRFSLADLEALDIQPDDLTPFISRDNDLETISEEVIGNSVLEQRPIIKVNDYFILALPTAVSAAVRRCILERLSTAGTLQEYEQYLAQAQEAEAAQHLKLSWEITPAEPPFAPDKIEGASQHFGTFDLGHYAHTIFIPGNLPATLKNGLATPQAIKANVATVAQKTAHAFASSESYRAGLTLFVVGGISPGLTLDIGKPPENWVYLPLSLHDFLTLGWGERFSALRCFKLLRWQNELRYNGLELTNLSGFANYYAYCEQHRFQLLPRSMTSERGLISLGNDFVSSLRQRIRQNLDRHLAPGPNSATWIELQRRSANAFFAEIERAPVYASLGHAGFGVLQGCVETSIRPWWVICEDLPNKSRFRSIAHQIWDAVLNWLWPAAYSFEFFFHELPERPIAIKLAFPDIDHFEDTEESLKVDFGPPSSRIENGEIVLEIPSKFFAAFAQPENIGERLIVRELAINVANLSGRQVSEEHITNVVNNIVRDSDSRFLHFTPARTFREVLHAVTRAENPRFVLQEDINYARWEAMRSKNLTAKSISGSKEVANFLNIFVDALWQNIAPRLMKINRRSIVLIALRNIEAVARDRMEWERTARALLALHQREDVLRAAGEREAERATASLAGRVLIEMAICTSPSAGGQECGALDYDRLVAAITAVVQTAGVADAAHHKFIAPFVQSYMNGEIAYDDAFEAQVLQPYFGEVANASFEHAATIYADFFKDNDSHDSQPDPAFSEAFESEYGVSLACFADALGTIEGHAIEHGNAVIEIHRSELTELLHGAGISADAAGKLLSKLVLSPRPKWDEQKPVNAQARDWYPWRFGRRLSVVMRPIVALDNSDDPLLMVTPALIDDHLRYVLRTYSGELSEELFDSARMREWIGRAANAEGAAFTGEVGSICTDAGLNCRTEIQMTELGGQAHLGDVDVLAWNQTGHIYILECKRLKFAKTAGEIAEQLSKFKGQINLDGQRDLLRRHLDRVAFLKKERNALSRITGLPSERMRIVSGLVTSRLVPMHFFDEIRKEVDFIDSALSLRSRLIS